jgi:hypothetical protein
VTNGLAHESSTVLYVEASTAGGIPAQPREVPRTIELSGRVALLWHQRETISERRSAGNDPRETIPEKHYAPCRARWTVGLH